MIPFVTRNPELLVILHPAFSDDAANETQKPLLIAAFAAGNARAQLRTGQKRDMPVEGVRAMLALYAKWKESRPDLDLPSLEAFARAEAGGSLEPAVEAAMADGG